MQANLRVPMETAKRDWALYQETYFGFSVRHFHESLREDHGMGLSFPWVKHALQGAGLAVNAGDVAAH